ncbi:MAG: glycoside hydrolase [Verrucomicrobia bacterium]|nr:glycoside hydrolase [Verrucomicrobiota bacterium]
MRLPVCSIVAGSLLGLAASTAAASLESGWQNPPTQSRLRAYWWWLNGQVTRAAITRDLESMKQQGFGGALLCDAGGADQDGNDAVPHGPTFLTPQWRDLYKHTLREADRLGLEMSLNIQSGWNLGGPMVSADDAAKKLVWSQLRVRGPAALEARLPQPKSRDGYYRDLFVVAFPLAHTPTGSTSAPPRRPLLNWEQKAMHRALSFSAPDTRPLFEELPVTPGEEDLRSKDVLDLSGRLEPDGTLRWQAPAGTWEILRFGCTIGDHARVSTSSDGWKGYALDVLDAGAFRRYWEAVVEPLIADAGPLAGRTLKYLHTDSWEVEAVNWTPTLRAQFHQRRGYDLLRFLPALAGRIVDDRRISNRFLHDYRKTLGDLAIDHHFRLFRDGAHRHGLEFHPESGGPHAVPIDAQRCLGWNDVPMSEFWAWSWRHRVGEANRFFVKQPASAAHTYGRRLVAAEGFTTIGPHWQETLWDNLKPSFDQAACEGLNLLMWHAFVCSPLELGQPGIQYFAGTHFNPNTTWWSRSGPFLAYINRCQWMLQQGRFAADVAFYYGDHVPNFTQFKRSDPARILPGYDYDVLTEEAILTRLTVEKGRLTLPDGMSYRLLVLPERPGISQAVLGKLQALAEAGAWILGPKPAAAAGLEGWPASDLDVAQMADRMWGPEPRAATGHRQVGRGRVAWGQSARDMLLSEGIRPDFEYQGADAHAALDYLHRQDDGAHIYFVANRSNRWERARASFRVAGSAPEIWDPVSGRRRIASDYLLNDSRVEVPLELPPYGSMFVVFREPSAAHPPSGQPNHPSFEPAAELPGPWTVRFDPNWGGPAAAQFDVLASWTDRPEPGIRYYSGTATYERSFDLPAGSASPGDRSSPPRWYLDLGSVRELAEVRLNGRPLGIVWAPPFRVDLTDALQPAGNRLEIDVVNFWPNRIIGDQLVPAGQRLTRTNIRKLTRDTPLMPSGLLGPVRLLRQR